MVYLLDVISSYLTYFSHWLAHQFDAAWHSGLPLVFWVRPKWAVTSLGDQSGKVVLITGANSGTGFVSARTLYARGAKVYLACRSESKAREAISQIREHVKARGSAGGKKVAGEGELVFLQMDLSDLRSVKAAAEEVKRKEKKLDILMCNAGIMATPTGQYTPQGYTLQFGTNHLGHHCLVHHLLPLLQSTSQDSPNRLARVIVLSSAGHGFAPSGGIKYRAILQSEVDSVGSGVKQQHKWVEYGQSKWGNIALARYLHAVYGPSAGASVGAEGGAGKAMEARKKEDGKGELLVYSVHPATNLAVHLEEYGMFEKYLPLLLRLIMYPREIGASNQLWLCDLSEHQAKRLAGEYIVPFQHVGAPRPDLLVDANVVRLWDWSEEQLKKHACD